MTKYEVMYIVRPTVEGEDLKKVINDINNIFTSRGSKINETKELGLKDLAYEIEGFKKGFYVWMSVEANNDSVNEYNRVVRINENIIRDIIVNDEE